MPLLKPSPAPDSSLPASDSVTQVPPTDPSNSFLRIHHGPANGGSQIQADVAAPTHFTSDGKTNRIDAVHTRSEASQSTRTSSLGETDKMLMDQLWDRFSEATGWKLAAVSRRTLGNMTLVPAINTSRDGMIGSVLTDQDLESVSEQELDEIEDSFIDSLRHHSAVGRSVAGDLAVAMLELSKRLQSARQANRRNQAELAARASVIATPEAQESLDARLTTILSDVVMACGCDAAAIYTLDDDTSKLSTRCVFGMSPSVMDQPPRGLENSRADVETMVRSVVMIDDVHETPLDTWNVPEECAAGICAVINSGDVPIGTLWLFSNQTQLFTNADSAAARMAARAIGVELTFAVAPSEDTTGKLSRFETHEEPPLDFSAEIEICKHEFTDELERELAAEDVIAETVTQEPDTYDSMGEHDFVPMEVSDRLSDHKTVQAAIDPARAVAQWQYQSLPIGAEIAPGWKADGMIESPVEHAIGWHLWNVLPDGMIAIAMAESLDATIAGTMHATVARAAFASHVNYRHTPDQLLARVGDTLWQTSLGQQLVSLLYACVDPVTGEGEIASAGQIYAIIGNRYGYRPLVAGDSDPLCMHIDTRSRNATFRMMEGETLLAYSPGILLGDLTHTRIGGVLHTAIQKAPRNPLAAIHRHLITQVGAQERGALTLVRS